MSKCNSITLFFLTLNVQFWQLNANSIYLNSNNIKLNSKVNDSLKPNQSMLFDQQKTNKFKNLEIKNVTTANFSSVNSNLLTKFLTQSNNIIYKTQNDLPSNITIYLLPNYKKYPHLQYTFPTLLNLQNNNASKNLVVLLNYKKKNLKNLQLTTKNVTKSVNLTFFTSSHSSKNILKQNYNNRKKKMLYNFPQTSNNLYFLHDQPTREINSEEFNSNVSTLTNEKEEFSENAKNFDIKDKILESSAESRSSKLKVQVAENSKKLQKETNKKNDDVRVPSVLKNCEHINKTEKFDNEVTFTTKTIRILSSNASTVTKMKQQVRLKGNKSENVSRKQLLNQEQNKKSSMSKSPKHNYKLIYFDARGICEPIRLLFHYSKTPFEDSRITRRQWLGIKDSTIYGKVPILEVDGKPLTYCHTISRYLARTFGLAGINSWEQAKVDEISDFHSDVATDLQPYLYVVAGFHQGDRGVLRKVIFLPNVEKHFPIYVNLLKQSKSGFFVNSGLTWIDFVISEYMTTIKHFEPAILDKYPAIVKFIKKVQSLPQIFEYIANREHQPVL